MKISSTVKFLFLGFIALGIVGSAAPLEINTGDMRTDIDVKNRTIEAINMSGSNCSLTEDCLQPLFFITGRNNACAITTMDFWEFDAALDGKYEKIFDGKFGDTHVTVYDYGQKSATLVQNWTSVENKGYMGNLLIHF